ncbi:insulinase family protein [Schumannella luteola]|nr:insulinase family protein [Schumannella luteola]
MTAGLVFRVGTADETVATGGITHLVEHLALFTQNLSAGHQNGETHDNFTHFFVRGTESQVVAFLDSVCASLRDLPVHRAAVEKDILRTEANGRGFGSAYAQRIERHGAVGPGVVATGELGLAAIDTEQILEWARTYFTRDNVVLWIAGDRIPPGLRLDLPSGARHAVPRAAAIPQAMPAYFPGSQGSVLLDAIVRRSAAAALYSRVLAKSLFRALRQEGGYSYTADCRYEPVDAERARITVYADALPEQQAAVIGGLVDVLAALEAGTIHAEDLSTARTASLDVLDVPHLGAAMLPSTAMDLLMGARVVHPAEVRREYEHITPADLAAIGREMKADALAQIPEGDLEWAGFSPSPRWSRGAVQGARYPRIGDPTTVVVIGNDGVSQTTPHGAATVLFDSCVGYLTWPDGARTLLGADGFRVSVEPSLHLGMTAETIAALDAAAPQGAVIPLPPRAPDEIPQPPSAVSIPKLPTRPLRWRGYGAWAVVVGVITALLSQPPWEPSTRTATWSLRGTSSPDGRSC